MKRSVFSCLVLVVLAWATLPRAAWAEARVDVLETWPAGTRVELAPGQSFYLRLSYGTDAPARIWARPYYQGREVPTITHGSPLHEGDGETFGWFALDEGQRVDEVWISAGDGSRATPVVARHRVEVVAVAGAAATAGEPAWIADNRARTEARRRAESERRAAEPARVTDALFVGGFMLAVPVLGILGLAAPVWAMRRWRGGWRIAAALPLVALGFVVVRIIVGVAFDPTSHNLWPFEILMGTIPGLVFIAVLALVKRA